MYGRAKCKACGKTVEAETAIDIRCPGCGRIFQIPNAPQYLREGKNPHRSIPDLTSTGPNRSSRVSSLGWQIRGLDTSSNGDWQARIQPINRKRTTERPRTTIFPDFPERGEPDVIEEEDWLWVIVAFPGHTIDEIEWRKEGNRLIIQSLKPSCPYQNEIPLPKWVGEPTRTYLRNGVLEARFEK